MSTNLNYKQVANVERRTWDLEAYEKRAKQRQQELEEQDTSSSSVDKKKKTKNKSHSTVEPNNDDTSSKPVHDDNEDQEKDEFRPATTGAAGPEGSDRAFLQARRTGKVADIDSRVGRIEMVSVEAAATTSKASASESDPNKSVVTKSGIGWHCSVCDCFLKDSHTYLDHINGRKHQRKLGYSMRVERSTKDELQHKLQSLVQKTQQSTQELDEEEPNFDAMVQRKDEELQKRREERKRRRKERKQQQPQIVNDGQQVKSSETDPAKEPEQEEAEAEEAQIDPGLAAMMGFAGFGGSQKN